jgi:hypothetical protein
MKYRHIVIPGFGGPENLLLAEDELLEPRANEVRVKVLLECPLQIFLCEKGFIRNL